LKSANKKTDIERPKGTHRKEENEENPFLDKVYLSKHKKKSKTKKIGTFLSLWFGDIRGENFL